VYDTETYEKWKRYSSDNCRLDIISEILTCLISVILLFTDVYAGFASLFPSGYFMQLLSVILLESAVSAVIGTIIGYVETMVIEEKYGFNRSTIKTFVFDRIRSLIIGFVLSLALANLIAGLYFWLGDLMVALFVAVVFIFTLVISFLYPLLSRIGNKFTPLPDGELKEKLLALLTKHGYKVKAIEVMDASRRTTKLNAYFTGLG
jgi:STE24 endopeptidase